MLTRAEVLRILQTWLRLQEAWRAHPQIAAEPINEPLFVVGPPRSGTTILLELLALDPQLRPPLAWEALAPLPAGAHDADDIARRRLHAECEQEFWADIHPEFMTMHELASDLPCECVHFLSYDFAGPYWSMQYDTPSVTGWQLEHLETLRRGCTACTAGCCRRSSTGSTRRAEALAVEVAGTPVRRLPQVFAEYPDAKVIHTHRDPRQFIASLVSLLAVLRFMRSDRVDVAALGPLMELTYQMFLEQVIDRARERHDPERPHRRQPLPRPDGRPGRRRCAACTSSSS